ncbi:hypothetical protein TKK_0008858 [Trichogramma kaykai]|uniref:Glucosylceramidase n=1 Tax=Trichogramma kaykai TaxID=54128 RepID=A0ABD2X3V7_9HYME
MLRSLIFIFFLHYLINSTASDKPCDPVNFGESSIVCRCNSTYCDEYDDPMLPTENEFIWYASSKSGLRLHHENGKISSTARSSHKIRINANKRYQSVEGFGGAFTDAAGINIKNLSAEAQDNLLSSYFGPKGAKYNLGRVPIGGSDFSTRGYTYDDTPGDERLEHFNLANDDLEYKIPMMKKALELNPELRFLSAAWTAPIWMKNEPKYYGYSYLQKDYYQAFSNYLIKFLEAYKEHGLDMWAISTGNEPFTTLLPVKISSMFWAPSTVSKWVVENFGPTLQKSSSNNTIILMVDDQRLYLPWFMLAVKTFDKQALSYISGVGVHWYTDDFVPASFLDLTHKFIPDKFILMTEACVGDKPWEHPKVILGSWTRAERLMGKMLQNLNHWVTGWVDWNLALNEQGGPNWIENFVDAPIIVDESNDSFYKQPMFYVLTHFSKFVPRGSVRIESISQNAHVQSIAFTSKSDQTIVILFNKSEKKQQISVVDDRVGAIDIELPASSFHTILYSGSSKLL